MLSIRGLIIIDIVHKLGTEQRDRTAAGGFDQRMLLP